MTQTATGDITTTGGDVLVEATSGSHWTMDGSAEITAGGQDVLGQSARDEHCSGRDPYDGRHDESVWHCSSVSEQSYVDANSREQS